MTYTKFIFLLFIAALSIPLQGQNCLDFDGTDDRINCGNTTSLQITGSYLSIEAWIYPTNFKTYEYENSIVLKEDNSNDAGFMFRTGDGGVLNFAIGDGSGGWNELTTKRVLTLNQWQFVAATYDGDYMRIYLDGKIVDSMSYTGGIGKSAEDVTIGDHTSYSRAFDGKIDEVRIWEVCRTQKQLYDNMNDEFCSTQRGLVAYYKFNQGSAGGTNTGTTSLTDYSGNGNTGTLEFFALTGSTSNWVKGASLKSAVSNSSTTLTRCNSYQSPSKKYTWTASGTYYDTLKTFMGCDSIIRFNLTIKKSTFSTLNVLTCGSYTSPSKRYVWTKPGKYNDRIANFQGCDSNITVNLSFKSTTTNVKATACEVYVSPSGKYKLYYSGVVTDTIPSFQGCDSILIIDVVVKYSTSASVKISSCNPRLSPSNKFWMTRNTTYTDTIVNFEGCDSILSIDFRLQSTYSMTGIKSCSPVTSPSKRFTYNKTGTYYDTIKNKVGCDSFITLNINIGKPSNASININACKSYQVPSKKRTLTVAGTYFDTITNKSGCDSIIQIKLNMLTSYGTLNTSACKSFRSPSGKRTYLTGGTYSDTIKNKAGCDSIISINLSIWRPNTNMVQDGVSLLAQSATGTFQWLDCNKGKSKISGETNKRFIYSQNGSYTVEVTDNNCRDTGTCIAVNNASVQQVNENSIQLYPNPNNGYFSIEVPDGLQFAKAEVYNSVGKCIFTVANLKSGKNEIRPRAGTMSPGSYLLILRTNELLKSAVFVVH